MVAVAEKRRSSELKSARQGAVKGRKSNDAQKRMGDSRNRHSSPGPGRKQRASRSGIRHIQRFIRFIFTGYSIDRLFSALCELFGMLSYILGLFYQEN